MDLLSRYEWLLFDADNTLFDFDGSSEDAFYQTLDEYQLTLPQGSYQVYKTINARVWDELEKGKIDQLELRKKRFQLFLDHFGLDEDPVAMNRDYLNNLIIQSRMIHDGMSTIKYLRSLFNLAIITNGLKEVQRPRIKKVEIEEYFEVIVVSDEIGSAKPHRAFFDHTFKEMGYPDKEKVLVIGDSLKSDIMGGIKYGLDTCWYNPHGRSNDLGAMPTFTIRSLSHLIGR